MAFLITCPNCENELEVRENDTMPGCREMESVYCPDCREEVTKVFTSGIPDTYVISRKETIFN